MPHSWNLGSWLNALGVRRSDQPDLIHAVQPVEILGDHSGFSSQILPPMAWMGGQRTGAGAGTYSGMQLLSRAPGGTYIRNLHLSAGSNAMMRFHITATPAAMANIVGGLSISEMGNTPTISRVQLGTFAAVPGGVTTSPAVYVPSFAFQIVDAAYIPPGMVFECWDTIENVSFLCATFFEDCPAQRSAA